MLARVFASDPATNLALLSALRTSLARADFDVTESDGALVGRRKRLLPSRGLFRLLIPRVVCKVWLEENEARTRVRPDGIAIAMCVFCAGGLLVEATADRATHPRNYPPEFILGLSLVYAVLLVLELRKSEKALAMALSAS